MRWAALFVATLTCGCGIAFSSGEESEGGSKPIPTPGSGGAGATGGAEGGTAMTGPGGAPTGTGGSAAEGGGGVGGEGDGGQGPSCAPVFEDAFTGLENWNVDGNAYIDADTLALDSGTSSSLVQSNRYYSVTSCGVVVETIMPPTNGGLSWLYMADALSIGYRATFVIQGNMLQARFFEGSPPATILHETAYDANAHRWWRLRRTQSEIIWDVAPDGQTWTQWHSEPAPPWGAGNNTISLGVTYLAGASVTRFDNLSVLVPSSD